MPSRTFTLYIPHSSDKTQKCINLPVLFKINFTSHIVQIKREGNSPEGALSARFTSHIVQIKQCLTKYPVLTEEALHPT